MTDARLILGAAALLASGALFAGRAAARERERDVTDSAADPADDAGAFSFDFPATDAWYAIEAAMSPAPLRLSAAGLVALQAREGLSLTRYRDPPGGATWSIGYGHQLTPADGELRSISAERAAELLRADVTRVENAVNALISVPLAAHEFDALVSFAFNVGTGAFARSTLRARVNARDAQAADEFGRWVYVTAADGTRAQSSALVQRRASEAAQFRGRA